MKASPVHASTLPAWLRANLGPKCLAPLTGTDAAALRAAVMLANLYGFDRSPEVAHAFGLCVSRMQRSTQHLAFHAIAHALDWTDRGPLWQRAGLQFDHLRHTRCAHEGSAPHLRGSETATA